MFIISNSLVNLVGCFKKYTSTFMTCFPFVGTTHLIYNFCIVLIHPTRLDNNTNTLYWARTWPVLTKMFKRPR